MNSFIAFVRKEFYHIFRDRRTMLILLGMPVVLIVLFGYAITTEIKESRFVALDAAHDVASQGIVHQMDGGEYFSLLKMVSSRAEIDSLFAVGAIKMAVIFPAQFEASLARGEGRVQLITDATDPNEATMLSTYATAIITAYPLQEGLTPAPALQITPQTQLLYNPQMKGAYNFVPGVMGLILMLICAMMTSVGIVRETESGTMEVLLVSPLRPVSIIIAKAIPYLVLSLLNIVTILLLSYFLLDVPIAGSLWTLLLLTVLYCTVALALGLFISTITQTTKAAMMISNLGLMLPVILLSGMIYPIENMPLPLQLFSNIVPARWFIIAVKDIMIKGMGIGEVLKEILILAAMAVVFIAVSVKRFKTRLE